jgi:hypothetical protein
VFVLKLERAVEEKPVDIKAEPIYK